MAEDSSSAVAEGSLTGEFTGDLAGELTIGKLIVVVSGFFEEISIGRPCSKF